MRKLFSTLLLFLMVLPLTIQAQEDETLQVVATFSILGDIVENIAGDNIELSVIVGRNNDTHTFEPTPGDLLALTDADLIFENGLEFETFLDDMVTNAGSQALRVEVATGIDTIEFDEDASDHGHGDDDHDHEEEEHSEDDHEDDDHDHEEEEHSDDDHDHEEHSDDAHEHGEFDPHWWMNPIQAIIVVENVRDTLIELDAANADTYTENAAAYIQSLQDADEFIREQLDTLAPEQRVIVTTHDSLGYFAEAYDFTVLSALGSLSTEASEPSPREIAEIIEFIESTQVPAIFAENINNPELIEQVASAAGVDVAPSLYTDALGSEDSDGASYIDMLYYNATTIAEALG